MSPAVKPPLRGEIWFVQLPADPPEKGRRPVVIVSLDARNRHERADTVLVIPLSTSIHKADHPTHQFLSAGETGLPKTPSHEQKILRLFEKHIWPRLAPVCAP
jgi:mRNA-degrading endonuclease toxin of MazEF toxin-antitoxin module